MKAILKNISEFLTKTDLGVGLDGAKPLTDGQYRIYFRTDKVSSMLMWVVPRNQTFSSQRRKV